METLFARHKPKKGMVGLMLAGSLLLHGGLVGIASLWTPPQPKEYSIPFDGFVIPTEGGDPIKPYDLPQTPPLETPLTTATPDILEPTATTPPPTAEDPIFFEPVDHTPVPRRTTAVRLPASSNRTMGIQTASPTSAGPSGPGTPGVGNSPTVTGNWVMPHPTYPHMVGRPQITGQTTVRVTTDAAGQVSNIVIVKSTGNPVLDNHTSDYVRNNWHGPSNASRTTEFVYELR